MESSLECKNAGASGLGLKKNRAAFRCLGRNPFIGV